MARLSQPEVTVTVPATTGNMGPGFDVLGMALELRNEVAVRVVGRTGSGTTLDVEGEGARELAQPAANRLVSVLRQALASEGLGDLELVVSQRNVIPLRRGLGSSAAAAAAGAIAGRALARLLAVGSLPCLDDRDEVNEILALALPSEGHADNLVPAVTGGLCLCWTEDTGSVSFLRLEPPEGLVAVLCVPDAEVATDDARRVLPAQVPLSDAVFSTGRAVLMVSALREGRLDLISEASRDRLHQPHRIDLLPAMGVAIDAACAAGALGAWVSGSGSTVLALCREADPTTINRVGDAMARAFDQARVLTVTPASRGAMLNRRPSGRGDGQ